MEDPLSFCRPAHFLMPFLFVLAYTAAGNGAGMEGIFRAMDSNKPKQDSTMKWHTEGRKPKINV